MKSLIILILLNFSYQINFELVYITIPHQTVPIDSNYMFYLTFFTTTDIKSKISEINKNEFNFKSLDDCSKEAKAVLIEEDPYTKDDCNFYIRIKYNINAEKIKIPNKIEGTNIYTITVNKALINQEYNLVNERNFNEDLNKNIILIEKINELSNDKSTFTVDVGNPMCQPKFGANGVNLVAVLNEESYYNCNFTSISHPYDSFKKTITCTFRVEYNRVDSINSFEFTSEYNDNYIFFYSKEEEGSFCRYDGQRCGDDNTSPCDSPIDLQLLYITFPNQEKPIEPYYIFYLTFFSSCNIKSKIADMNAEDLDAFHFYIPEECMNLAKAVSVEEDPFTKDDCNCNYYIRIKYYSYSHKIKLPNKIEGSDKYRITVNEALINQEYNLKNERNLDEDLSKTIILIEKINELSNDKRTFTINVGIPICKSKFGDNGKNFKALINGGPYYNCLFTDISPPYDSFDNTITCTSQDTNTVNSVDSFIFSSEYNNDYIFFYSKEEEGTNCFEITTFDLNDNLSNKKSDILHPNSDPLNSNIYLVNDRNAVFNIFFDQKYFRFIKKVKFYVKYKSMDSKDITKYCIPTLSRYINYTQVTCQFDLFDVLQDEDINSLINSLITIQYGSSEDDLKDYKKYYIKRGMEQPYFHDFKGSINRNYYKDGVKVDF